MSAPVIGLSTYAEPAQWAAWQAPAALLPTSYIDQVTEAGGVPLLLPPVPGIARALGRLDGLILTGGGDLDPAGYGAEPDPRTSRVHPERDQAELELLAAALADGLPILGICRGMQLINVARGGTLYQDLAAEGRAPAHTRHVRIASGAARRREPAHLHPAAGWRPRRAHAERADRPSPGHRPARRRARPRRLGARTDSSRRSNCRPGRASTLSCWRCSGIPRRARTGGWCPRWSRRRPAGGGPRPGRGGQPGGGSPLIPAVEHLHSRA